jgi:hypothetical protein
MPGTRARPAPSTSRRGSARPYSRTALLDLAARCVGMGSALDFLQALQEVVVAEEARLSGAWAGTQPPLASARRSRLTGLSARRTSPATGAGRSSRVSSCQGLPSTAGIAFRSRRRSAPSRAAFSLTGPSTSRRRPSTSVRLASFRAGGTGTSATRASLPRRRSSASARGASLAKRGP